MTATWPHPRDATASDAAAPRLILIDQDDLVSSPATGLVAYWSSIDGGDRGISIPQVTDRYAEDIRSEYIHWVYEFGKIVVRDRTIREWLYLPCFSTSAWWLTLLAEQSPMKSPAIYTVFKLRALERLYHQYGCQGVTYHGADLQLDGILRAWCGRINHPYERVSATTHTRSTWSPREFVRRMPHLLQAVLYFLRAVVRAVIAGRATFGAPSGREATVVTYFPNIDPARARVGEFRSRYWDRLHDVLETLPVRVTWVWIYGTSDAYSFRDTVRFRDLCIQGDRSGDRYAVLDSFHTPVSLGRAVLTYLELAMTGLRVGRMTCDAFRLSGSDIDFYDALVDDWHSSLFGKTAMDGALFLAVFAGLAEALPTDQRFLLYVWERQAWEHALLSQWRRFHSAPSIGHPHAVSVVMSRLNLRTFPEQPARDHTTADGQTDETRLRLEIPDMLICTGEPARETMVTAGYAPERVRVAEALRYESLRDTYRTYDRPLPDLRRTLLVVTGYLPHENRFQLTLLRDAARRGGLRAYERILIKPHPYAPTDEIAAALAFDTPIEITNRPLSDLWQNCDVVLCANSTSVVVEAAWVGKPVIVTGPGDSMNVNPLFGSPNFEFTSDVATLCAQLSHPPRIPLEENCFMLNDRMDAWRDVLAPLVG